MRICSKLIKNGLLLISLLVFLPTVASATSVISTASGGDPTVGYQGAVVAFADGDLIRGHEVFKDGLTINSASEVTWDGDGIVGGAITFTHNTSTLKLSSDLRLGTTGSFTCAGTTMTIKCEDGCRVILGNDLALNQTIKLKTGDLVIDGQGHTLTLIGSSGYLTENGRTLTLRNMTLVRDSSNVNAQAFFTDILSGSYILENVTIRCKPYAGTYVTLFPSSGTASLKIRGRVVIDAPGVNFALTQGAIITTLTIEKNSTLAVGKNTAFVMNTADTGGVTTFSMADQTSILHLDGCDFYTGGSAVQQALNLTKGTVLFENKVRVFNALYDTSTFSVGSVNGRAATGIIFGDGTQANDMDVRVLGGAYVINAGYMRYNHS